jgi:hypothetical protein
MMSSSGWQNKTRRGGAGRASLFEHDLFGKPDSTPDHVEGMLFRIMLEPDSSMMTL